MPSVCMFPHSSATRKEIVLICSLQATHDTLDPASHNSVFSVGALIPFTHTPTPLCASALCKKRQRGKKERKKWSVRGLGAGGWGWGAGRRGGKGSVNLFYVGDQLIYISFHTDREGVCLFSCILPPVVLTQNVNDRGLFFFFF